MIGCPHFLASKNKFNSNVPEENEIPNKKSSISSDSNMQAVETEAGAYNAKRTEVKVIYSSSNEDNSQSMAISAPSWDDSTKLASFLTPTIEKLLPAAGWRGSVASENDIHYRGVGSMFTLYMEDGSTRRTKTPPVEYEIYKNLSHIPLAIYSSISPYFLQPTVGGWEDKLKIMTSKITAALSALQFESNNHTHALTMLTYSAKYIQDCLNCKAVYVSLFQKYYESMLPYITVSMARAVKIQVASAKPQLDAWKSELEAIGKWNIVYVIISTVWLVGHDNPRQQIFKQLMNEEQFKTYVIMSEMPCNIEESFNLLARVVDDRIAARLIFGCSTPSARSMKIFGEEKENQNIMNSLLTSLTASQLRNHASQSTSDELQKASCHAAVLMKIE